MALASPGRFGRRTALAFPLLSAGLAIALILSVAIGPVVIHPADVLHALLAAIGLGDTGAIDDTTSGIVLGLRVPRSLMALAVGAMLATGGATMQGLFRNPLADPTLIGVSGGAALAAASFIVFGGMITWISADLRFYATPLAAFMGGMAVVLLIRRLAQRDGRTSVATMLLAGIAINAVVMAGIGLLSFIGNDAQLRSINFWSLGSLGGSGWSAVAIVGPMTATAFAVCLAFARVLDGMMLGEREAFSLGFDVETAKRVMVLAVAAGVGAAVAFTGLIAFVGVVAPHMMRLVIGPSHRSLLIGAAMLGGLLLLLADILCRLIIAPAELPIGIVTSLIGAPFFLALLLGRQRATGDFL